MKPTMFQILQAHWPRRLLSVFAFLFVVSGLNCKMEQPMAQGDSKFEQKFVDKVQGFRTEGRAIKILFKLHAAEYTIDADHANFKELMTTLAEGWQQQSSIQLVVLGTTIRAVDKVVEKTGGSAP